MLKNIKSNRFRVLPYVSQDQTIRSIEYHSSATRSGFNCFYYDPRRREKIDCENTSSQSNATRLVPNKLPSGWIDDDANIERTPLDASSEYDAIYIWHHNLVSTYIMMERTKEAFFKHFNQVIATILASKCFRPEVTRRLVVANCL